MEKPSRGCASRWKCHPDHQRWFVDIVMLITAILEGHVHEEGSLQTTYLKTPIPPGSSIKGSCVSIGYWSQRLTNARSRCPCEIMTMSQAISPCMFGACILRIFSINESSRIATASALLARFSAKAQSISSRDRTLHPRNRLSRCSTVLGDPSLVPVFDCESRA